MPIGYDTTVWQARFPKEATDRKYGWQGGKPGGSKDEMVAMFDRDIWKPDYRMQLVRSRLLGEMNISGDQRGFGRMSADFWGVIDTKWGKASIVNRYPLSNWAQLSLRMTPYLHPGPEGALATVRFEMLREGVQECEARIFLEKSLLDKDARAKVGEGLAKKAQDLLDERVGAILDSMRKAGGKGKAGGGVQETSAEFADGPWQERSAKLYAVAAEVAEKIGAK